MIDRRQETLNLIEDYRDQCLWFLREDYIPATDDEIMRTLEYIERYGDRSGYQRAEEIKEWLLRRSSRES